MERESAALHAYVTANPTDGFKRFNEEKARDRARGVADGRLAANQREQASRANDRRAAKWKAALPFEAFRDRADAQAESDGQIRAREADLVGLQTQQEALKTAPDLDADGRKVLAGLLADQARRGAEMEDLANRKERIAHGKAARTAESERRGAKVAATTHEAEAAADDRARALAKLDAEDKLQLELCRGPTSRRRSARSSPACARSRCSASSIDRRWRPPRQPPRRPTGRRRPPRRTRRSTRFAISRGSPPRPARRVTPMRRSSRG